MPPNQSLWMELVYFKQEIEEERLDIKARLSLDENRRLMKQNRGGAEEIRNEGEMV